jgi:ribonuclease BN (tRNA processing enzyme)
VTRVTFVGTSDAFGAGGRRQAAIVVETAGGSLLLDCAPTTVTGLAALGIDRRALDAVVVTHFHADHFAGIPSLVLASTYADRRRTPLVVAGPPGVEARVRLAAQAIGHDFEDRDLGFPLRFAELAPGRPLELAGAHVQGFGVHHQPESLPHGLRVTSAGQTLAYTGDTGWFDALPEHVAGSDLCICECNFLEPTLAYHLDYRTLGERAEALTCGRLLLTHLGAEMSEQRGHLALETADDGLALTL